MLDTLISGSDRCNMILSFLCGVHYHLKGENDLQYVREAESTKIIPFPVRSNPSGKGSRWITTIDHIGSYVTNMSELLLFPSPFFHLYRK